MKSHSRCTTVPPKKKNSGARRWTFKTSLVLSALAGLLAPRAWAADPPTAATSPPLAVSDRVAHLVSSLTDNEAIDLLGGTGFGTQPLARAKIPAFQMSDGPIGVRSPGPSTAFAGGIALAASWDVALAQRVGVELGRDARSRGVQFLLGPGVNIYRAPMNGRNFEYFGEDPWLGAGIAVGYVEGVQSQNVSATIKHFLGNNSEFARRTSDSAIDERALREIYLPIFEAAVKEAHVGAVMCSYNSTNGLHMSENPELDTDVLKHDWGFAGLMMSDWDATHDGVASVKAGLDLEMPTGKFMNRETLLPALKDGRITRAQIDDKLRRLFSVAERFGWFEGTAADVSLPRYSQTGREVARQGALEGMVLLKNDKHLLPLDPSRIKNIAVIGPLAYPGVPTGGGSARVQSFNSVSFLRGISEAVGTRAVVTYADGIAPLQAFGINTPFMTAATQGKPGLNVEEFGDAKLSGAPLATRVEFTLAKGNAGFGGGDANFFQVIDQLAPERRQAFFASLGGPQGQGKRYERWTGYFTPQKAGNHLLFVQDRAPFRLLVDDQLVIDSSRLARATVQQAQLSLPVRPHKVVFEQRGDPEFGRAFFRVGVVRQDALVEPEAKRLAAKADAVIVPVGFDADEETEASDRSFELPPGQSELIRELAAVNPNLVVVITSGGSVSSAAWLGQARALIAAWFPGQEGGSALGKILLGEANPSGRLPISWERRFEDNPSYGNYYYNDPKNPARIVYKEGIFSGYRGYAHANRKPLFPFGFGLSYTTFEYSKPVVTQAPANAAPLPSGRKPLYLVNFDITNTGARAGAEVAQVYVAPPASAAQRPKRELKGFTRIELSPGQKAHVILPLDVRAFTYFDVKNRRWQADAGKYGIELARSAEDVLSTAEVTLTQPLTAGVNE